MTNEAEEIAHLKALNASLMRKLKGVRAARKRDAVNYEENLTHVKNGFDTIVSVMFDKKQRAKLNFQSYMFYGLEAYFVNGTTMTPELWNDAVQYVTDCYKILHKDDK